MNKIIMSLLSFPLAYAIAAILWRIPIFQIDNLILIIFLQINFIIFLKQSEEKKEE